MVENNNHNKNNMPVNPFSPQYPADPLYFADRKEYLDYFTQSVLSSAKIRPPAPANFIVLGDWGMGKTSMLYKMRDIVLKELASKVNSFCFHFSLDPICCRSWDKFCLTFLTQLKKDYQSSAKIREKLSRELSKWTITVSVPPVSATREKEMERPSLLDSLEGLWKKHLASSHVDICLLFLDDAHYFLQADQPDAYFTIRNTFQELARRECNYSLILSGPRLLFKEIVDLAEPFTRFFHQFYLEPFTLDGTMEAIKRRVMVKKLDLEFSEDTIFAIHEKSKGHPYFVMFIAYELVNLLGFRRKITAEEFEECWPRIISLLERSLFVNRLEEVSEREREVLIKASLIDEPSISPSMIKGVKGVTEFFSRLERKGLLLKKERGLYELFHPLFRDYLRKLAK
jgi:hypothetical protein